MTFGKDMMSNNPVAQSHTFHQRSNGPGGSIHHTHCLPTRSGRMTQYRYSLVRSSGKVKGGGVASHTDDDTHHRIRRTSRFENAVSTLLVLGQHMRDLNVPIPDPDIASRDPDVARHMSREHRRLESARR